MSTTFKYEWGQAVRVLTSAPENMRPGKVGSICGMRKADDDRLYLVEFSDGETIEIPENLIEAMTDA